MLAAFCIIAAVAYADCSAVFVLPPCPEEDSNDCYWQAPERGNGMGQSFVNVDGIIYEWDGIIR